MKYKFLFIAIFFSVISTAQISTNGAFIESADGTSAFMNASGFLFSSSDGFTADGTGNIGKGLVLPRTDLTAFTFTGTELFGDFPTQLDGMVVYNVGSGSTPATGSGIGNQPVTPGFYYFSNPGSTFDTNGGNWLPLGGPAAAVKEATITGVVADGENATLDLGTTVLAAGAVTTFIDAKVYNGTTGALVLTAGGAYDTTTNVLTTGNGFINQVLPALPGTDTYTVVVFYR